MQLSVRITDRLFAVLVACCLGAVLSVGVTPAAQGKTIQDSPVITPNVIGGTAARPNAYPWIAALVRAVELGGEPIGCGGSLIEPLWVVTAAHCLFDPDSGALEVTSQLNVLIGTNNLLSGGQRIAIAEMLVHENYSFDDISQKNDIALLRLATPANRITIAPLTPEQAPLAAVGRIATAAGWGATDNAGDVLSFTALLDVALPVVSDSECNAQSENNADTQLCAGGDVNRDSCPGDSGGPLVVSFDSARAALAGIVSRGPSTAPNFCGDSGFPGIYTRVSAYRDWIVNTIEGIQARPVVIASAVLPSSRSVIAGASATAFMSIVNAGQVTAQSCQPLGPRGLGDAQFSFTATDPATNTPNAGQNAAVNIAPGESRSFVFSLTRSQALESVRLPIAAYCINAGLAGEQRGVNDLIFSVAESSAPAPVDVIALGATGGATPGVVDLVGGQAAFAVATSNAGATGSIRVSANSGNVDLGLAFALCETTGSALGECLAPASSEVVVSMAAGGTHSFSIFVGASLPVFPDFARNRIEVRFENAAGIQRGGTSVAVQSIE